MSTLSLSRTRSLFSKAEIARLKKILPGEQLLYDDGEPMESDWHVKAMLLLTASAEFQFRDRDDFYTAGNMFIYFGEKQAKNRDFRGPDFFLVWDTTRSPMRNSWVVWEEDGRTPNIVIELCSASTIKADYGKKKEIYESILRVDDYFCYNPAKQKLDGWRLKRGKYVALKPNEHGQLWSEELGLWVSTWTGEYGRRVATWLRFFDRDGQVVLTQEEAAERRADTAEAETAELRSRIALLEHPGHPLNGNGRRKKK